MCTSPRKITHRSNHWNENIPLQMYVPCGKCEECQRSKRNDWFVRCWYQWRTSAMSFMYTLTYNNEHLPRYCNLPVFSRRDIQLFIKNLRKSLALEDVNLKYMVTSEFGEKYGRPHYHAVFFLDKGMNPARFRKLVEFNWCKCRRDGFGNVIRESRGFVQPGDNQGVVNRDNGIEYVVKYITKDISFSYDRTLAKHIYRRVDVLLNYYYRRYGFKDVFLRFFPETCVVRAYSPGRKLTDADESFIEPFLKRYRCILRNCVPFHLQSTCLGVSFLDSLQDRKYELDTLFLLRSSGQNVEYVLPRYFKRKLWYDVVENEVDGKKTLFVLNDAGKEHYFNKVSRDIEAYKDKVASMISRPYLSNLNKDVFLMLAQYFHERDLSFRDEHQLVFFLHRAYDDLDMDVLAVYKSVFRGRICTDYIELNRDIVMDNWQDIAYYQIYQVHDSKFDLGRVYELSHRSRLQLETMLWDKHPYFAPYEYFCSVLECIDIGVRSVRNKYQSELDRHRKNVKDILRNGASQYELDAEQKRHAVIVNTLGFFNEDPASLELPF